MKPYEEALTGIVFISQQPAQRVIIVNTVSGNMAPSAWPRQFTGHYVFVLLIVYIAFGLPKFLVAKTPDAANKLPPDQLATQAESGKNSSAKQDALRRLEKMAHSGNPTAECSLGALYARGRAVPQDYVKAANWFRKAADQGDAKAECILGFAYGLGHGVPYDLVKATKWWRKAAARGYAEGE